MEGVRMLLGPRNICCPKTEIGKDTVDSVNMHMWYLS